MINKFFWINLVFSLHLLIAQNSVTHELIYQSVSGVINPQISPNSNYLSFTSPNYSGLYLLNIDDKSVIEITDESAAGFGYSWSPSGHAIAYKPALFLEKSRYNSLVVYELGTGQKTDAISEQISLPGRIMWIDSNKIYLSGKVKNPVINFHSGKISNQQVEYNFEKNTIYSFSKDRTQHIPIFKNNKEIHDIIISPDKNNILYEEYGGDLIILNLQDKSTINLGIGHEAEWSPDGNKIVFMRTSDDGYTIIQSDIFVVNADGTNKKNITLNIDMPAMRPTWYGNTCVIYDSDINNALYKAEVQ